ncbi:MAG: hypothetical protein HQ534_00270 [Armatimonadetes bacterium]|nr:hypothetical protein [Armatimonadota bacterium]
MNKYLIIIIAYFIIGCSAIQKDKLEKTPEFQEDNSQAVMYFSMAETAIQQNDFGTAIELYKRADKASPGNIYIKEKLLNLLRQLIFINPILNEEIVKLGEKYRSQNLFTSQMLIIIADSHIKLKDIQKADEFLKLAIETEPSMESYSLYYSFQKDYNPPADTTLLNSALKLPWEKTESVIKIAQMVQEYDIEKALSILQEAYKKWDDEKSLQSILIIYEDKKEIEKGLKLVEERLEDQKPVPDFMKIYLIEKLFAFQNYEEIIELKDICFEIDTNQILRYLFFSAANLEKYDLAISAGKAIEKAPDLTDEMKPSFLAYLGDIYYLSKQDKEAVEYFIKSNELKLLMGLFREYTAKEDDQTKQRIIKILDSFIEQNPDKDLANFLAGFTYMNLELNDESENYFNLVSADFIKENGLLNTTAEAYLTNSGNTSKAVELLELRDEQESGVNEFLGFYFYLENSDSLSFYYLYRALKENPQAEVDLFLVTSIVAEKLGKIEDMILILEDAIQLYPQSPDVLNTLGYSIAKYEIKEKYEDAEEMLQKALQIESENNHIWDSLAWLYFKMDKYEQALQAMEKPLEQEIKLSELAYHLGEIYLKLDQKERALEYLKIAIDLANDEKSVELSKKLLEELNK